MTILDKIQEHLKAWRKPKAVPTVTLNGTPNYFKAYTAPAPDVKATIHDQAGNQVGTVSYGLSPLGDRVYLFDIRIDREQTRRGFATAVLLHLMRTYGQPITPVKELHSASGFWDAARNMKDRGLVVTKSLGFGDMDFEAERWAHLAPAAKALESAILKRLAANEPWEMAVGRGLDEERAQKMRT